MLPYYDIQIAKQHYAERLNAAETERQWVAVRRQQPSVLQQLVAAIQGLVRLHRSAPARSHSAATRNA